MIMIHDHRSHRYCHHHYYPFFKASSSSPTKGCVWTVICRGILISFKKELMCYQNQKQYQGLLSLCTFGTNPIGSFWLTGENICTKVVSQSIFETNHMGKWIFLSCQYNSLRLTLRCELDMLYTTFALIVFGVGVVISPITHSKVNIL